MSLPMTEIYEYLEMHYPKEACGVITDKGGWIPIKNVAEKDDEFIMDTKEYTRAALSHKITGVVHSHIDASPEPSEIDIKQCNGLNLDYIIINLPDRKLYYLKPGEL